MARIFLLIAALLGLLGVAIGAFGAHGLQARLEEYGRVGTFETANRYHLYGVLALVGVAILMNQLAGTPSTTPLQWAGGLLIAGTVIFSGSLYLLAIFNIRIMGAIAPIGGVLLLLGWAALGVAAWRMT